MTGLAPHSPVITVNGRPLTDVQLGDLVSMRVEVALGLVGRATLRFADPGYVVSSSTSFALGAPVEIAVPGGPQLISGTITGASLDQGQAEHPVFTVVVDDAAYKMTRGTRVSTYLESSYAAVVQTICGRNGLTAKITGFGLQKVTHEYLLQAGTDMAFLNSMVQRTGYVWWIEGSRTLRLAPGDTNSGQLSLTLGGSAKPGGSTALAEFSVKASGLRPSTAEATGWDHDTGEKITGKNRPIAAAGSTFGQRYTSDASIKRLGTSPLAVIHPGAKSTKEAEQVASTLYADSRAGSVVARGTCDVNGAIRPLVEVEVSHAGPASGKYVVSEVEHTYTRNGFFTHFVAGPRRPTGLVDTLGAPAPDEGFSAPGLVIGLVTNINDEDKLGRVKVTYAGISGEVESAWGRLVTLGAGGGRGITFAPEVGDEVLVGFERGDTRNPVVLGGLFSKKNLIVDDTGLKGGKVEHRRITSRLGHVVELADGVAPGDQHILMQLAKKGHRLRLGADRFDLELAAGKPLLIAVGTAKIAIDEKANITIEGTSITLKATAGVKVEGAQVDVKATGVATVEGAKLDLKGQGPANLTGGGPVAIKGAIVAIN